MKPSSVGATPVLGGVFPGNNFKKHIFETCSSPLKRCKNVTRSHLDPAKPSNNKTFGRPRSCTWTPIMRLMNVDLVTAPLQPPVEACGLPSCPKVAVFSHRLATLGAPKMTRLFSVHGFAGRRCSTAAWEKVPRIVPHVFKSPCARQVEKYYEKRLLSVVLDFNEPSQPKPLGHLTTSGMQNLDFISTDLPLGFFTGSQIKIMKLTNCIHLYQLTQSSRSFQGN